MSVILKFPESQTNNWIPLKKEKVQYIVLHHPKAITASPEDINKWHLIDNGWAGGFGYNEYIRKDGTVYIGRGENIAAHVAGFNSISYGVSVEGDFEVETMNQVQFDAVVARLKELKLKYPNAKIVRHKDLQDSDCPGKNFPYNDILAWVNKKDIPVEKDPIDKLVEFGIIKSPDYWRECTKPGAMAKGEYVAQLIKTFANKLGV